MRRRDTRKDTLSYSSNRRAGRLAPVVERYFSEGEPVGRPELQVFPNLEDLSQQAASRFEELANRRITEGHIFAAALSGGSTPRQLYQLLASPPFSDRIPWRSVHLFQVDERCVAPDHPDSNYRMVHEALLSKGLVPALNFHRIAAELPDRDAAARQYADELARILKPHASEWPRLDLVFLGMGPDGHTASLFPGSSALNEESRWVVPNYVDQLKAWRLTLTLPVLNAAAEVIFLVAGADKAETLRRVLDASSEADQFPAQRIRPVEGQVSWYVEQATRLL